MIPDDLLRIVARHPVRFLIEAICFGGALLVIIAIGSLFQW